MQTPEQRAWVENLHALRRLASSAEIAKSVLYLAADLSGLTSGAALFADGGASIARA
nr:SDR family oxidoreductase [Chromobacterium sphagni]